MASALCAEPCERVREMLGILEKTWIRSLGAS